MAGWLITSLVAIFKQQENLIIPTKSLLALHSRFSAFYPSCNPVLVEAPSILFAGFSPNGKLTSAAYSDSHIASGGFVCIFCICCICNGLTHPQVASVGLQSPPSVCGGLLTPD